MNKETLIKDVLESLIYFGLALFGSAARTLSDNIANGKRGWALATLVAANMVISGFCGLMILPIARVFHMSPYLAVILAGMAGWMGVAFLVLIEKQIVRRIETHADNK